MTLVAFPARHFPTQPPLFRRNVRPVDESFYVLDTASVVEVTTQRRHHGLHRAVVHPLLKTPVTRLVRREAPGKVMPRRSGSHDPEDPLENEPGVTSRSAPLPRRRLQRGEERLDKPPLDLGQLHQDRRSRSLSDVDPSQKAIENQTLTSSRIFEMRSSLHSGRGFSAQFSYGAVSTRRTNSHAGS